MLGFHLTPTRGEPVQAESWSARRGKLSVVSRMHSIELNRRRRRELVAMTFDVHMPSRAFRLGQQMTFRTYTAAQFRRLLTKMSALKLVATCDFAYQIDRPIQINAETEDIVWVLRKQ